MKSKTAMLNLIQHLKPIDPETSSGLRTVSQILALPLVGLVVLYQKTLSPDHGPQQVLYPYGFCQFYPSCSEYARLTLLEQGFMGLPKIIKRLVACR